MLTGIPFYLHPAEHPCAWAALLDGRLETAFAVVNVDNGPGRPNDPYYGPALAHRSVDTLVGYVDVAFGDRPVADVLADVRRWWQWYGIDQVMLDCVPSAPSQGAWNLDVVDATRDAGAQRVIVNPGVPPCADLLWRADVTCIHEEVWPRRDSRTVTDAPADRLWWLAHGVPPRHTQDVLALARADGAGFAHVTDATLPNPWGRLPAHLSPDVDA